MGCFGSKDEHKRFTDLLREQCLGLISDLRCQVPFSVVVEGKGGSRAVRPPWKADFVYRERGSDHDTIEDRKGVVEDYQRLTIAIVEVTHGITVKITGQSKHINRAKRKPVRTAHDAFNDDLSDFWRT